ncbi:dienelactone hydrolase family protein [Microbulbifer halophilus]|uniref:Dienelactone hydrolase family protein n=1 Tax=Microbulbifer halophilus TaxID=453963 RepID=A0ABW5EEH1_9GAMM|nr:dienelactone hydrolase family protein [Microbulbifer halophilus]MCW8125803.1 dienelactone hydrolase family protein [Microbulbifer halophilus]
MHSETIEYTVEGDSFTGYIAYDDSASGKRPGILLIHEWWGHNEFAREEADKLAAEGYTAFALDMFGTGKQADNPDDAAALMNTALETPGAIEARFRAALEILQKHETVDADKIAAQGYCFGGAVALNMARLGLDLKGVVSFHGNLASDIEAKPGGVKAELRVYTGGADDMIPADEVSAFVEEMQKAGAKFELTSYPGVKHGFTNPAATGRGEKFGIPLAYDEDATRDAWEGATAFYRKLFG